MQIKGLHKNIYKLSSYALSQEKLEVHRKKYEKPVKLWEQLKSEGVSDKTCQTVCRISRATYYRYKAHLKNLSLGILPPSKKPLRVNKPCWGEAELQLVLKVRREDSTYGKEKITEILKRDYGFTMSESTVGRIIKHLKERGLITKSGSALRTKRKRNFKGHAKPWSFKDYKTMVMGERVQIDHMTVTKNGICFKHFQAWDRVSKYIDAQVYSNAKSSSAKRFLLDFVRNAPYKILSIQVDGGSEFMAEFEEACAEFGIPLIVLPPKKPSYNGGVERGNRTFREEFYNKSNLLADSLGAMRAELKKATEKYNTYRPHRALKKLTPMAYIQNNILKAA